MSKTKRKPPAYLPYLRTLRRIPKDIVLSMATREVDPNDYQTCLCGWAIREALAFANGWVAELQQAPPPDNSFAGEWHKIQPSAHESARLFGGGARAWNNIYKGITDVRNSDIELAFARRVAECVR